MKKLFLILLVIVSFWQVQSQTPTYPYDTTTNQRKHGSQYLLSEPFEDSCTWLDVFSWVSPEEWEDWSGDNISGYDDPIYMNYKYSSDFANNSGGVVPAHVITSQYQYVADLAQPYLTDTTLKISGIAIFFPIRYYLGRHGYLGIADSNLTMLKRVPLYDIPQIPRDENTRGSKYWLNYEEFIFDTSVNVQGKFYVVYESPKPAPYTGYGWDSCQYRGEEAMIGKILAACRNTVSHFPHENCTAEMLPLMKQYELLVDMFNNDPNCSIWTDPNTFVHFGGSDTTWHSVANEFDEDDQIWPHRFVYAYYMFPIFGDIVDTSSSVADVKVENYTYVFPNPASNDVTIQCSFKMQNIEVFNEQGQKIEDKKIDGYNYNIDVSNYAKGSYFVKITTTSGIATKKILVQ